MTVLTWAIRLIIFVFLVVFALQNTAPVTLRLILDQQWQAPLVMLLLVFFAAGAVLGVLSLLGVIVRQRREIAQLKRRVPEQEKTEAAEPPRVS